MFNNYFDDVETIKYFWECSLNNTMDEFNFDEAFNNFSFMLREKLAHHGLLEYSDFYELMLDYITENDLKGIEINNDWIQITADELREVILKHMYNRYQEEFFDYPEFQDLIKLHEDLENYSDNMPRSKKVALYDRCIHAQHVTGFVMDISDIDELRTTFENTHR